MQYLAGIVDNLIKSRPSKKSEVITKVVVDPVSTDMVDQLLHKIDILRDTNYELQARLNYAAAENRDLHNRLDHSTAELKNVIFDKNATTILWSDGSKTTVKAYREPIDHEKGLAMAMARRATEMDISGSWKKPFYDALAKAEDAELKRIVTRAMQPLKKVYHKAYDAELKRLYEIADSDLKVDGTDIYQTAHSKALQTAIRKRKKYIPTETGLPSACIEEAVQDALTAYSAHSFHQW